MASFGEMATNAANYQMGYTLGQKEQEDEYRKQNIEALKLQAALGQSGIDPAKLDLSGVVTSGNQGGQGAVSFIEPGLFTKPYETNLKAEADKFEEQKRTNKSREDYQTASLQAQTDANKEARRFSFAQLAESAAARKEAAEDRRTVAADNKAWRDDQNKRLEAADKAKTEETALRYGPNRVITEKERNETIAATTMEILRSKAAEQNIDIGDLIETGSDGSMKLTSAGAAIHGRINAAVSQAAGDILRSADLKNAINDVGSRVSLIPGGMMSDPRVSIAPRTAASAGPEQVGGPADPESRSTSAFLTNSVTGGPTKITDADVLTQNYVAAARARAKLLDANPTALAEMNLDAVNAKLEANGQPTISKASMLTEFLKQRKGAGTNIDTELQRDARVKFEREVRTLRDSTTGMFNLQTPIGQAFIQQAARRMHKDYPQFSEQQWATKLGTGSMPTIPLGRDLAIPSSFETDYGSVTATP